MEQELFFGGEKYISSKRASLLGGLAKDYITELCRAEKVIGKRVGRNWYINQRSLLNYLENSDPKRHKKALKFLEVSEEKNAPEDNTPVSENLIKGGQQLVSTVATLSNKIITPAVPTTHIVSTLLKTIAASSIFTAFVFVLFGGYILVDDMHPGMIAGHVRSLVFNVVSKNELAGVLPTFAPGDAGPQGLVVVPTNSDLSEDGQIAQIKNSFSDEVVVNPDDSGTSGVITPVFKTRTGDDFVYVMVPINEKTQ